MLKKVTHLYRAVNGAAGMLHFLQHDVLLSSILY